VDVSGRVLADVESGFVHFLPNEFPGSLILRRKGQTTGTATDAAPDLGHFIEVFLKAGQIHGDAHR
jgi:hypothetical protein